MPSKKSPRPTYSEPNPYTRFFNAHKSLPPDKNGQKQGVYNRESVYVLSNKSRGKRRSGRENNLPTWRRRGGNEDHIMVVTQDNTQQQRDKPLLTASQLDSICYDVIKEPPMQFHVNGTT
ncbi:GD11466 [Drosophila simulans]|uniref:GD11466 n=1 Tax=Drosophila simulans TaxID=7240 RepID=B4QE46_DROSI|nr:GD11466 [Drosophila simulans]